MKEPTDQQLKEYWENLPDYFRQVFRTFLFQDQSKMTYRVGRRLTFSTLHAELYSFHDAYLETDTARVLDQLVENDLLNEHEGGVLSYSLTPLGEKLLVAAFQPMVVEQKIPSLPAFSWAS